MDIMKTFDFEKALERLVYIMENEKVYLDPDLSFGMLCLMLGVAEADMEKGLYNMFGVSGNDILNVYRRRIPLCMMPESAFKPDEIPVFP